MKPSKDNAAERLQKAKEEAAKKLRIKYIIK